MDEQLRKLVHRRAQERCEYCHPPQAGHDERFSIDHVIPRKHGGKDEAANLTLCCLRCNLFKGSNLSGIDPVTNQIVTPLNPRRDDWTVHFRWKGADLVSLTPVERATIAVLSMK